jgi:hypothetical protein
MRSHIYRTKAFLDEGKGKISYVQTQDMKADGVSKPFGQPGKYASFASMVLGHSTTSQPVGVEES